MAAETKAKASAKETKEDAAAKELREGKDKEIGRASCRERV